jgi:hypothetical protein
MPFCVLNVSKVGTLSLENPKNKIFSKINIFPNGQQFCIPQNYIILNIYIILYELYFKEIFHKKCKKMATHKSDSGTGGLSKTTEN